MTRQEFRTQGLELARKCGMVGAKLDVTARMGLIAEYKLSLQNAKDLFDKMSGICQEHLDSLKG